MCDTTAPDVNASACNDGTAATSRNQGTVLNESCSDTIACDYICNAGHSLI